MPFYTTDVLMRDILKLQSGTQSGTVVSPLEMVKKSIELLGGVKNQIRK